MYYCTAVMELKKVKIPEGFLEALPQGIKYIRKNHKDFLVIDEIYCSDGHNLKADYVQIHGEPSIRIDVDIRGERGSFFIDAFWGSYAKLYSFIPKIEENRIIIQAFCPLCGINLMTRDFCEEEGCGTEEHVELFLPGTENRILVCARLGCPGHKVYIYDVPVQMNRTISEINYFGAQIDDIFKGI